MAAVHTCVSPAPQSAAPALQTAILATDPPSPVARTLSTAALQDEQQVIPETSAVQPPQDAAGQRAVATLQPDAQQPVSIAMPFTAGPEKPYGLQLPSVQQNCPGSQMGTGPSQAFYLIPASAHAPPTAVELPSQPALLPILPYVPPACAPTMHAPSSPLLSAPTDSFPLKLTTKSPSMATSEPQHIPSTASAGQRTQQPSPGLDGPAMLTSAAQQPGPLLPHAPPTSCHASTAQTAQLAVGAGVAVPALAQQLSGYHASADVSPALSAASLGADISSSVPLHVPGTELLEAGLVNEEHMAGSRPQATASDTYMASDELGGAQGLDTDDNVNSWMQRLLATLSLDTDEVSHTFVTKLCYMWRIAHGWGVYARVDRVLAGNW